MFAKNIVDWLKYNLSKYMKLSKSEAGHLGGLAQIRKNGNPATFAGRKLGGLRSLKTHKKFQTSFIQRKKISKPRNSEAFAEFTGVMLGDGHIGKYQSSITTHGETDLQHALFISNLATQLFSIEAPIRKKKTSKAVEVVLSSFDLCRFLEKHCFKAGNKVHNQVPVPIWIKNNILYTRACLRGLFDTDGCIFLDRHTIKGVMYQHMGLVFTNFDEKHS